MTLRYQFNKPCHHVFDHLTDTEKFVAAHPIIYKMENLGDGHFKVFEKMKAGLLPYSFTYKAHIQPDEINKTVVITASVMRMVHIKMNFQLQDLDGKCQLTEEVTFTSRLPVRRTMEKVFRQQHEELFNNINQS